MKVYLAGAMSNLTFEEMNGWRVKAQKTLRMYLIDSINPVEFYNFEMNQNTFTDKECMKFDLQAIRHSDLILVNLNHNSIGTAIELFEANRLHISVIGFGKSDKLHPWMKECVDTFCVDLNSAIEYINSHYNKIL